MSTLKRTFYTCFTAVVVCLLGGCAGDKQTDITILGENAATIQSMMALKDRYMQQHPDVRLVFKPNSYDDSFTKANQDFVNGTGLYDIVMQYNFSLSSFVRNKYIYDMPSLLKNIPDSLKTFEKDLFPAAWQEVGYYSTNATEPTRNMVKVGYPWASNTMLLMYNKAMFNYPAQKEAYRKRYGAELQVPQTWEDFVKVSAFFKQPDKNLNGVCLQGANGGWIYFEWMNFLFGMGGKTMDKQYGWQGDEHTRVTLNSPQALQALTLYKSLKPYNSGNYFNVDQTEQMKIMMAGKTAMAIVWSDLVYPSIKTKDGFNPGFGFAAVPGKASILAGGAFFINKKSKHPDAAMRYIVDIMQPKTQVELAKRGLCSALRSVYDDPQVKALPYAPALQQSLARGTYTLEAGPDANMISEKITTYIQKTWNDQLTPKEALDKIQSEVVRERQQIFAKLKTAH